MSQEFIELATLVTEDTHTQEQKHYTIEEAEAHINELTLIFLQINLMQTLIQQTFTVIKKKGIDFSLANTDKLIRNYDQKNDESSIDALSSLKCLIEQIQSHVKRITSKGFIIDNMEKASITIPHQHQEKTVWLRWKLGDERILEWSKQKIGDEIMPISQLTAADLTET